jgi:hypothetical protein
MNCKPGDLAVIVRSTAGNEGKIVRCIEMLGNMRWVRPDGSSYTAATWLIDRELLGFAGESSNEIADWQLRPIRDPGDATDETLEWLPVPVKEHA